MVIVIPGLLTALTEPAAAATIVAGTPTTITAQVRMMCGCMIDNLFWPAANFSVQANHQQRQAWRRVPAYNLELCERAQLVFSGLYFSRPRRLLHSNCCY